MPVRLSALTSLVFAAFQTSAHAESDQTPPAPPPGGVQIGGHVGVAVPVVMSSGGQTTTVSDQLTFAHPIGIGFKLSPEWTVDFETIFGNPVHPRGMTGFTVDPGVIYNAGPVAVGLRVKWDIGSVSNFGVIPLVNRGLVHFGKATWFVEAAFPMTYTYNTMSYAAVIHTGVGF